MIETLGWSLVHFVWQGFLGAGLLAALLVLLRRATAQARYLASCATLAILACCPLVNSVWFASSRNQPVADAALSSLPAETRPPVAAAMPAGDAAISEPPFLESPPTEVFPPELPVTAPLPSASSVAARAPAVPAGPAFIDRIQNLLAPALPWVVAGWLAGVVVLSLRLLSGWRMVQRVRRAAVQPASVVWQEALQRLAYRLRISRPVKLVESALVEVPSVIGWFRPVILLPACALAGLDAAQLEALLAHELAHIRRHDYLVNLVQTAIETLLFYHPAVWWVSRRIRNEREHCCDDLAVSICGNRTTYVRALAVMEELRASPALTVAATGGSLAARIRRLVRPVPDSSHSIWWGASLISLTAALVLAGGSYLVSQSHARALAEADASAAASLNGDGQHNPRREREDDDWQPGQSETTDVQRIFQTFAGARSVAAPANPALDAAVAEIGERHGQWQSTTKGMPKSQSIFSFRINGLRWTVSSADDMELLEAVSGIDELVLHSDEITNRGMTHLAGLTGLRRLELMNPRIDEEGLAPLASLVNLEEFRFYGAARLLRLDNQTAHPLAKMAGLRILNLVNCEVDDSALHVLGQLKRLRVFWSQGSKVTDEGLSQLKDLAHLETLDLFSTQVTDAGIAHLRGIKRLRKLNIRSGKITDAGIDDLLHLSQLEDLNLSLTQLTDAGLARLARLKMLRRLNVRDTRVTIAGVDRLQQALPNLAIETSFPQPKPTHAETTQLGENDDSLFTDPWRWWQGEPTRESYWFPLAFKKPDWSATGGVTPKAGNDDWVELDGSSDECTIRWDLRIGSPYLRALQLELETDHSAEANRDNLSLTDFRVSVRRFNKDIEFVHVPIAMAMGTANNDRVALTLDNDRTTGWPVAGDKPSSVTFEFSRPIRYPNDSTTIRIEVTVHRPGTAPRLARLRIRYTRDIDPFRLEPLPEYVKAILVDGSRVNRVEIDTTVLRAYFDQKIAPQARFRAWRAKYCRDADKAKPTGATTGRDNKSGDPAEPAKDLPVPEEVGRDAKNPGLRYSVEIKTDVIKADRPRVIDPKAPEIKLGGDLWLTAKLHNDGDKPMCIYWGDYAEPKMYRFEVTHESGWKPPVTRWWPDDFLPRAASEKYFVVIQPGEFATYDLLLTPMPGANCEHCYFNRPGRFTIKSSLFVVTDQILNETTGETRAVPGAWTGALEAAPLVLKVAGDPKILDEGVTIRGKVVDNTGNPIAGALVTVHHRVASFSSANGFARRELAQDLTDAEGRFEFFRLPEESPSFELHVRHPEFLPKSEAIFNDAPAGKKRSYVANLTLDAGRTVRGRVVDSQGKPVADVRFTMGEARYVYSNDEGRFTLTGLPAQGDARVNLWRRGFANPTLTVPPAHAPRGLWRITVHRQSEQTITGKAVFADGKPLANMDLIFATEALKPPDTNRLDRYTLSTKTDAAGDFTLVLPEAVEFDVKNVTAHAPGERHLPHGIWRTTLGRVMPQQADVRVTFDDARKLAADVRPARPLPESMALAVRCELLDEGKLIEEILLDHKGGQVEFKRLSPGKYRVTVAVMPQGYLTSSKDVEIDSLPDGEKKPPDARLFFDFPDLRFGRLIGQVVTPDGEPAPQAQIYVSGHGTNSFKDLDANARFEFEPFPVGDVRLSPRLKGFDDRDVVWARVREGKTEAVQVVLKPLAEVLGAVAGRILYEDGVPALGAAIQEDFVLNPRPVDEKGSYEIKVRKDRPTFSITLNNADGWPRIDSQRRLAAGWETGFRSESLEVTMPIESGRTTARDIVLDRKRLGRLTLNWKGPAGNGQLVVSVIPLKDPRRAEVVPKEPPAKRDETLLDGQLKFVRTMLVKLEQNGKLVIPDVPQGHRHVWLAYDEMKMSRIRTLPPEQVDAELTIDPADVGSLHFKLLDGERRPKSTAGFELSVAFPHSSALLQGLHPSAAVWNPTDRNADQEADEKPAKNPYLQADGSYLVSNLDPGQYELVVRDGIRSKTLAIEIKPRETTALEVRLDELKVTPR